MKRKTLALTLLLKCFFVSAQEKELSRFTLTASGGVNIHPYTKNYVGWYTKLGMQYRIWKGFFAGFRLWHSNVDEFPSRFKSIPFSADDEANFIQSFIGTPEKDWFAPKYKGFYHILQGHIASVSAGYEFRIKKKFFITPHYSFSLLRSKFITVGLYDASFSNGFLINGKVYYDIRIASLTAGSVGFDIGYKLNNRWKIFVDLEDIRDLNGTGWLFYDAKTFGVGAKYSLK